jgi:ABC-2 type transport system ATP-binding protein
MKQRLSIARVLLHDPKVLLLDEPASGLDPRARIEIRELLKELHRMGKTIIISSHILHELAELCTTVGIIERGELQLKEPISEIIRRVKTGTTLHIRVTEQMDLAALLLQRTRGVRSVDQQNGRLIVELEKQTHDFTGIAQALLSNNFKINEIKEEEVNLETAFMRLTKGMVQ